MPVSFGSPLTVCVESNRRKPRSRIRPCLVQSDLSSGGSREIGFRHKTMTLRCRILMFEILTLVVLVSCIYVFYSRFSMQSYNELEYRDAEQNTDRARRAFQELDDSLHDKSVDWANWDDTYKFMADHNQAYVKSNLVAETVASMKLDTIMYVNNSGRLFHRFTVKRSPNLPVPDDEYLWHSLHPDHPDGAALGGANGCSGVILHPSCPMLVSVRPISDSKGTAPRRGRLLFGRYFDNGQLRSLSERTRLNVQIFRVDSASVSPKEKQMLSALATRQRTRILPVNGHTILGYALLPDVRNRPALLLKIALPRHIHQQGLAGTNYMVHLIFIASLAFSGVTQLVLE